MSQSVTQGVGGMLERITRSRWGSRARQLFFLTGDAVLLVASLMVSALLRFDGRIPQELWPDLPLVALISLGVKIPLFASQRLYALSWSQVSLDGMIAVVRGVTLGTALFWIVIFTLKGTAVLVGFPRSILLIDYVVTLHAVGGFRMALRAYRHLARRPPSGGRPALIVGAGAAGEQLARSLASTPASGYGPVGFIDDDPGKTGSVIHGLRVLSDRQRMPAVIRRHSVEAVLIAMPSAPSRTIRQVVSLAREAGVREIRIIPGLDKLLNGRLSFTDLRDVRLADLLGREVVTIDSADVARWLQGRVVLVTGAGGSIGSELSRQIVQFGPQALVLLDWDESGLFWTDQDLRRLGHRPTTVIGDIRDAGRMREIFGHVRPHVVFHAAAYKHVGLMERHPEEAVRTNILGTLAVARASVEAGAQNFIFISTDKAVNPTAVMGATKRAAEQICLALNGAQTRFLAVRFGNVLGSRGSVVPLFQDNIRRGEAITIRGPNMRRYFMATSEAVLLVLQAGAMGEGGEIFVLDMGEPVRIIDLATEMIRLSGLEPDQDVPIIFADPEPGEKEHEEDLLSAEEGTVATTHERIFVARATPTVSAHALFAQIGSMEDQLLRHDLPGIVRTLEALVPTYRPSKLLRQQVISAAASDR